MIELPGPIWEIIRALNTPPQTWTQAAAAGDIDTIEFLIRHSVAGCTSMTMDEAATWNHFNIVKLLYENGAECTEEVINCAAYYGRLDIIELFHGIQIKVCTERSVEFATGSDLHIIKWLDANRPGRYINCDPADIQLEIVKWSHANRPGSYTNCDPADDQLDYFKWFHANRAEDRADHAMSHAANHPDVIKCLFAYKKGYTSNVRKYSRKNNHANMVDWLAANGPTPRFR